MKVRAVGRRASDLRLPRGHGLGQSDWDSRHRLVVCLLAVHAPLLLLAGWHAGLPGWHAVLQAAGPQIPLVLAAAGGFPRRARSFAAGGGLLLCSAVLVTSPGAGPEAQAHFLVAVAFVGLYQDWAVYAFAGLLAVGQNFVAAAAGLGAYDGGGDGLRWAAVQAVAVGALAVSQLAFWQQAETADGRERDVTDLLASGEQSLLARQAQLSQVRADLLGNVSHEFRTPLTVIKGAALTLRRGQDRLPASSRAALVDSVLDHAERLSRLLENMLAVAESTPAGGPRRADMAQEARAALAVLGPAARPEASLAGGVLAAAPPAAVRLIVANLLHNAHVHGVPAGPVVVTVRADKAWAVLSVGNDAAVVPPAWLPGRAFDAFVQADPATTRRADGAGLGLFAVRRLAEAHGGTARMDVDGTAVVVTVRLPSASGTGAGSAV